MELFYTRAKKVDREAEWLIAGAIVLISALWMIS